MAEHVAPPWVDADLIQEALRRDGDEDTVVKAVTLQPVGAAGDHYGSTMFRITAATTTGTKSIIVKTMPPGETMEKTMKECGYFRIESFVLSDLIPQMHKILDEAAPGRFPPFTAKCPHYGDQPDDFIFLEDLAPQGFRLADRHRGLGLRHSLLALRTLARFHATSAALLARDPTLQNILPSPFSGAGSEAIKAFSDSSWQLTLDACTEWPNFPAEYVDAVAAAKDVAVEKYRVINEYHSDRFNVILHGDFWINNMMFRYESEEVQDIRLVDLQISHVTTPAVDILYFLNTSVSEDVFDNHLDLLVREYHLALESTLDLLGLEAPSLKELLRDLDEYGFYSTFGSFLVLPLIKTQKVPDLEKYFSEDASDNKFTYTGSNMEKWFRKVIPKYIRKGWL